LYTEGLGDLTLPLSYFHYDAIPDLNYVIATPAGGKRDYTGAWLTFRKRRTPEDCFLRMTCRPAVAQKRRLARITVRCIFFNAVPASLAFK
jgi:hypothetical protein